MAHIPPLILGYASQPTTVDGSVPYRRLVYQLSMWLKSPTPGFIFVAHKSYCNNPVTFQHRAHLIERSYWVFIGYFLYWCLDRHTNIAVILNALFVQQLGLDTSEDMLLHGDVLTRNLFNFSLFNFLLYLFYLILNFRDNCKSQMHNIWIPTSPNIRSSLLSRLWCLFCLF